MPQSAGLKIRQGEKEGVAEREAVGLGDVDGETVVEGSHAYLMRARAKAA